MYMYCTSTTCIYIFHRLKKLNSGKNLECTLYCSVTVPYEIVKFWNL